MQRTFLHLLLLLPRGIGFKQLRLLQLLLKPLAAATRLDDLLLNAFRGLVVVFLIGPRSLDGSGFVAVGGDLLTMGAVGLGFFEEARIEILDRPGALHASTGERGVNGTVAHDDGGHVGGTGRETGAS
jgi:hypothetical protein